MEKSFLKLIEHSIKEHWHLPSLTDYEGAEHNYKDVAAGLKNCISFSNGSGYKKEINSTMQPEHLELGNCFSRHAHLRGGGGAHPQRVQTRYHYTISSTTPGHASSSWENPCGIT